MTITGYGPVNPLETEPRYTTVPIVKDAMGIETGVTQFDAAITTAIVTIEYLIDAYLEHSFPDPATPVDTDPVVPPPIEGIPIAVTQAATLGAVKTVKLTDMPFGVAGSDDFIGTVDFAPGARRAFNEVMPLLLGFKRAFGVA